MTVSTLKIGYCSAPAGAGKTRQMIVRACEMARKGKIVLFAQPTKDLIDKTVRDELLKQTNRPRHRVIHGGSIEEGKYVAKELADYLGKGDTGGEIIFTTQQVLQFLPAYVRPHVHLMIDECPQVFRDHETPLPVTHKIITEDVTLKGFNAIYGTVEATNEASLSRKARNKDGDAILDLPLLRNTLGTLTNTNWQTFADAERYRKLLDGKLGLLPFHSILKQSIVSGYASVFMAGACFKDSGIYLLWSKAGVEFVPDADFASKLRFDTHRNGELVKIYYVTKEHWSRRLRTKKLDHGAVVQDLYLDAAKKLFGANQILWHANKKYTGDPFGSEGILLPSMPHGLNIYSNLHDLVFASATNPTPAHIKFMRNRGLSEDEIRASTYYSTAYQAVMRTSIRNPDDTNQKRIVVPDLGLAEYLQKQFPGSTVEWLDAGLPDDLKPKKGGRPRRHASNAARVKAQRSDTNEKKMQRLRDRFDLQKSHDDSKRDCELVDQNPCAEMGIEITTSIGTGVEFHGSIFEKKKASKARAYLSCNSSCHGVEHFIGAMKEAHKEQIGEKEENLLISPAMFDPSLSSEKDRGIENVVYCRHLFLDFEDGDLKPEEIPSMFPFYKMLITNTYSHTEEHPRFRVIIPTSQPVTADDHEFLFNQVVAKFESSGYSVGNGKKVKGRALNTLKSGLDLSKRRACSLFYAPVQATNPQDSFFDYYDGPGREFLDPMQWIENTVISDPSNVVWPEIGNRDLAPNQTAIDAAIEEWQSAPHRGNGEFFQLGLTLSRSGMGRYDIEATLREQADFANSPSKRKSRISSIITSLRRYGWMSDASA